MVLNIEKFLNIICDHARSYCTDNRRNNDCLCHQEQRRRQSSSTLLQAFVRGCLTRAQQRRCQRALFDELVKQLGTATNDRIVLAKLLSKLLFFYRQQEDPLRLVGNSSFITLIFLLLVGLLKINIARDTTFL